VHLAAAGLLRMEIEINSKPLQEFDHGTASFREERVVIASNEQRGMHDWGQSISRLIE
jgi:hypothetical protein